VEYKLQIRGEQTKPWRLRRYQPQAPCSPGFHRRLHKFTLLCHDKRPHHEFSLQGPIRSPLFFQGGINLSYAVNGSDGGALPCFSSFLEETRSSQSTSAVLKDFLLGGFPVCSLTITKQCDTANPPVLVNNGTQVLYSWKGVVHDTGVGTLSGIVIDDNLPTGTLTHPTLLDSATNSPTTTLAPDATGSYTATATVASLTAKNTASARGFFGTSEIDAPAASDTCTAPISTAVGVVKHCVAPGPGLSCSARVASYRSLSRLPSVTLARSA
jgi:hypothetical protein